MDHNEQLISNQVKNLIHKVKNRGSIKETHITHMFSQLRQRAIRNNRLSKQLSEKILYFYQKAPMKISSDSRNRIISNVLDLGVLKEYKFPRLKKYNQVHKKRYNRSSDALNKRLPGSYGSKH
jgi:hypothetical protein